MMPIRELPRFHLTKIQRYNHNEWSETATEVLLDIPKINVIFIVVIETEMSLGREEDFIFGISCRLWHSEKTVPLRQVIVGEEIGTQSSSFLLPYAGVSVRVPRCQTSASRCTAASNLTITALRDNCNELYVSMNATTVTRHYRVVENVPRSSSHQSIQQSTSSLPLRSKPEHQTLWNQYSTSIY